MNALLSLDSLDHLTLIKMLITLVLGGQSPHVESEQTWIAPPLKTPELVELQIDVQHTRQLALSLPEVMTFVYGDEPRHEAFEYITSLTTQLINIDPASLKRIIHQVKHIGVWVYPPESSGSKLRFLSMINAAQEPFNLEPIISTLRFFPDYQRAHDHNMTRHTFKLLNDGAMVWTLIEDRTRVVLTNDASLSRQYIDDQSSVQSARLIRDRDPRQLRLKAHPQDIIAWLEPLLSQVDRRGYFLIDQIASVSAWRTLSANLRGSTLTFEVTVDEGSPLAQVFEGAHPTSRVLERLAPTNHLTFTLPLRNPQQAYAHLVSAKHALNKRQQHEPNLGSLKRFDTQLIKGGWPARAALDHILSVSYVAPQAQIGHPLRGVWIWEVRDEQRAIEMVKELLNAYPQEEAIKIKRDLEGTWISDQRYQFLIRDHLVFRSELNAGSIRSLLTTLVDQTSDSLHHIFQAHQERHQQSHHSTHPTYTQAAMVYINLGRIISSEAFLPLWIDMKTLMSNDGLVIKTTLRAPLPELITPTLSYYHRLNDVTQLKRLYDVVTQRLPHKLNKRSWRFKRFGTCTHSGLEHVYRRELASLEREAHPPDTIVIHEAPVAHPDGGHVVRLDGRVEWLSESQFRAAIASADRYEITVRERVRKLETAQAQERAHAQLRAEARERARLEAEARARAQGLPVVCKPDSAHDDVSPEELLNRFKRSVRQRATQRTLQERAETDLKIKRYCAQELGEACTWLGKQHYTADENRARDVQAAHYFNCACEFKDGEGCLHFGLTRELGRGAQRDLVAAAKLYAKSCKLKWNAGCGALGLMYANGLGVERDILRAKGLAERACQAGQYYSCYSLGLIYERAAEIPTDHAQARFLYQTACEHLVTEACVSLAQSLRKLPEDQTNPARIHALYTRACRAKQASGCIGLAEAETLGIGVKSNLERALIAWERACLLEDQSACRTLGDTARRVGGPKNLERARLGYESACTLGDMRSCNRLGLLLREVSELPRIIAYYYERACTLGNEFGCFNLGHFLLDHAQLEVNVQPLRAELKKRCERDEVRACLLQGKLIQRGRLGAVDHSSALTLFGRFCSSARAEGCGDLARAYELGLGVPQDQARAATLRSLYCAQVGYNPDVCRALTFTPQSWTLTPLMTPRSTKKLSETSSTSAECKLIVSQWYEGSLCDVALACGLDELYGGLSDRSARSWIRCHVSTTGVFESADDPAPVTRDGDGILNINIGEGTVRLKTRQGDYEFQVKTR